MAMRYNPQTGQWEWYPDGSEEAETVDGTPTPQTRSERGKQWQFNDGKVSSGVDWDSEFAAYAQEQETIKQQEELKKQQEEELKRIETERLARNEGKTVDEFLKAQDIRQNGNVFQKAWQGIQDIVTNVQQGTRTQVGEETIQRRKEQEGEDYARNTLAADMELKRIETEIERAKNSSTSFSDLQKEFYDLPKDIRDQLENYSRNQTTSGIGQLREFFGTRKKDVEKPELYDRYAPVLEGKLETNHYGGVMNESQYQDTRVAKLEEMANIYRMYLGYMDNNRDILTGIGREFNALNAENKVPFIGAITELEKNLQLSDIVKRYSEGSELSEKEMDLITEVQAKMIQSRMDLGYSETVGGMLANMPTFMAEFFMTGGIANAGKAATTKVIGEAVEKKTVESMVKGFARTAIGEFARTSIGFAPHIANKTAEYMLPRWDILATEDGDQMIVELDKGDNFQDAFVKAGLSQYVENLSESAGLIVEDGLPFLKKAILGKVLTKYAGEAGVELTEETSKSFLKQLLAKGGWNGIVGEVFEEEIAEPAQARIEGRQYFDPITTPEGRERLLTETLGITIFAGISQVPETTISNVNKLKNKYGNKNVVQIDVKPDSKGIPEDYQPTQDLSQVGVKQFDDVTELLHPEMAGSSPEEIKKAIQENPEAWQPILNIARESNGYADFQAKVESAVKNEGLKLPDELIGSGQEMFRTDEQGNLVALHNISIGSLRTATEAGGLAAPSIAVAKADLPFDSFGEVTLVGNKELVTPNKKTQTRVFAGDIYSPTVNDTVEFPNKIESLSGIADNIKPILEKAGIDSLEPFRNPSQLVDILTRRGGISEEEAKKITSQIFGQGSVRIKTTKEVTEEFAPLLKVKSIYNHVKEASSEYDLRLRLDSDPDARRAFESIADDLNRTDEVYEIINEFSDQIFAIKPATVNNIVASINQRLTIKGLDVRGSEGGWGVPARVFAYREFKTLAEIKKFEGLLTDAETASFKGEAKQAQFAGFVDTQITDMEKNGIKFDNSIALYDAINSEEALAELVKGLKMLPKLSDYDTKTIEGLDSFNNDFEKTKKSNKRVMTDAIRYAGYSAEASDIKKFTENLDYDDFVDKMNVTFRDLDTEYFEAKIMRAVDINEFAGAIVPDEIAPDLVAALESKGLKVAKYSYFKEGDRFKQLAEVFGDVRFRRLDEAEGALRSKLSPEDLIKIRTLNEMMFGDRNVGVVEKIITPDGMEAVGKYASNWIEIADKQANATDTFYHESVHKAIDVFLSGEQKAELFVYGKSKYKLEGLALEEKIAEDFINFVNGDKKLSIPQKITQIFKDLLSRITGFKEHTNIIERFYTDLLEGNLKSNQKNIKISEQLFNTLKEINAADNLSITEQQNESNQENAVEEINQQSNERQEETPKETVWEAAIAQKESIKGSLNDGEDVVLDYVDEMRGKSFEESAVRVLEELETAQAGFRYAVEGSDGFQEWRGQKSTFPSWFSLRTRKEIDDFLTKIPDNPEMWTLDNNPFKEGTKKAIAWGEFIGQLDRQTHESILEEEREAIESFLGYPVEQFTAKLDGIIKKDIEDRTTQSGQVALSKELKPKEVVVEKTTSVQKRQAAQTPIEQQVGNKLRNSRVYEKLLQSVDEDLQQQPQYERMNIRENLDRAIDFVESNYAKAKRVALGLENPPANITEIAIRRAMAAKAQIDGDMGLYEQLIRSRSLRLTRLGQEIVSERGAVDQDNPEFYLQELTSRRMDIAAKQLPMPTETAAKNVITKLVKNQKISNKEKVTSYIDTETKNVRKILEVENIKIAKAQDIIDLLTC